MNNKVSLEVAEKDFERFIEEMDIDADVSSMDEEDLKSFNVEKSKIIKAIVKGSLIISEEGFPVFTPVRTVDSKPITFYEPTGASLMAMDKRKKNEDFSKFYNVLADITKTDPSTFAKLKMSDLKVCIAIGTLFLA